MLEDLRSQMSQFKSNSEAEMTRLESRIMSKIEENSRNTEKYVCKQLCTKM